MMRRAVVKSLWFQRCEEIKLNIQISHHLFSKFVKFYLVLNSFKNKLKKRKYFVKVFWEKFVFFFLLKKVLAKFLYE